MQTDPVLYAEDEENDVFLLRRAFKQAAITNPLEIVGDGQQAIDFLTGAGQFGGRRLPCLALLDLNMPRKSGFDVLTWIRQQPAFQALPLIVLTSSTNERDIEKAYALGANAYLVKPSNQPDLIALAKSIGDFWLHRNRRPMMPRSSEFPSRGCSSTSDQ